MMNDLPHLTLSKQPATRAPRRDDPAARPPCGDCHPCGPAPSLSRAPPPDAADASWEHPATVPENCCANSRPLSAPTPATAPRPATVDRPLPSRTRHTPHAPRHRSPQPPTGPYQQDSPPTPTNLVMENHD